MGSTDELFAAIEEGNVDRVRVLLTDDPAFRERLAQTAG